MFKSLTKSISDDDFKKIISESFSLNEAAKKLGFTYNPGSKSREKIKNKMIELGVDFNKGVKIVVNPTLNSNYNTTKDVGLVGEKYFEFLCAKNSISCFKMNGDNLSYDYLIEVNNKFLKVQVKTVEYVKSNKIIVRNKHGNYNRASGSKDYSDGDYDLLFAFSIEKELGFLINSKQGQIVISLEKSKNNQVRGTHYYQDYLFENVIKAL